MIGRQRKNYIPEEYKDDYYYLEVPYNNYEMEFIKKDFSNWVIGSWCVARKIFKVKQNLNVHNDDVMKKEIQKYYLFCTKGEI